MFLDDDLVDTVKPGDRVKCSGIYRALTHNNPITSGVFRTVVLANSLAFHGHGNTAASLSPRDLANIRKIVRKTRCAALRKITCYFSGQAIRS